MPWMESLPTRERGLKLLQLVECLGLSKVAPHAGAWIETALGDMSIRDIRASLRTRERGLKHVLLVGFFIRVCLVAPHAGAWIESGLLSPKRPLSSLSLLTHHHL